MKTSAFRLRAGVYQILMATAGFAIAGAIWAACSQTASPESPSATRAPVSSASNIAADLAHPTSAPDDHGLIDGWYEGSTAQLYYTKSYFCEEPPSSGTPSECEIGAPAEVAPRPGPIPTIYAIAAAGFVPPLETLACPPGSTCLDHPAMIDASRVVPGATSVPGLPHSHIVESRQAGWHHTVNVRVFSLDAWNQIAAAKTLTKVRELQGDPAVGTRGVISADTPTNVYFFIASWRQ
jgi:hypothetical protein